MIKITRFFYVHILIVPLFILAYFVGALHTLFMAYSIVTVHELFHLFAALLLRERVGSIIIMPFGMTLRLSAAVIQRPSKEILIALAGPFANAVMLAVGVCLKRWYIWAEQSMFLYWYLNWITMLLNLLPVLPLDGGRVMRAILVRSSGYLTGMKVMRTMTKIIAGVMLIAGILLILVTGINISLVMIGAFLMFNMMEEKKTSDLFVLKELLRSKERLLERKLMPSKVISVTENTDAKQVISKISYDSYRLIYIDEKNGGGRLVSEAAVVDAVLKRGYGIKMKEIP